MEAHEEHVVQEHNNLRVKCNKLSIFVYGNSIEYKELPPMEKEKLHLQLYLMLKYRDVLSDRIQYFLETG